MRPDRPLVLFLSTGRCGTQWLADNLEEVYGDLAVVEHEPLGPAYRGNEFFRAYDRTGAMGQVDAIAEHLEHIRKILPTRIYIETGWPLFSAIPLFVEAFPRALRLVHLTRHPVPTAISHMVHKTYAGSPRRDGYTTRAALGPWNDGVIQRELLERWDEMTPYEKTLFWWTELHLYAGEVRQRYPHIPFHRVRAEDLLRRDGTELRRLCDFMTLPWRRELAERVDEPVDRWHHRTEDGFDWRLIYDHPRALALSRSLGYSFDDIDDRDLTARYSAGA